MNGRAGGRGRSSAPARARARPCRVRASASRRPARAGPPRGWRRTAGAGRASRRPGAGGPRTGRRRAGARARAVVRASASWTSGCSDTRRHRLAEHIVRRLALGQGPQQFRQGGPGPGRARPAPPRRRRRASASRAATRVASRSSLGRELPVDAAHARARGGGDRRHRGVKALLREHLARGPEQRRPLVLGAEVRPARLRRNGHSAILRRQRAGRAVSPRHRYRRMTRAHSHRTHPNLILGVLSLAGLAYAMLSSAVVPALPTIQHALGATETQIAWLLTAYLLAASVGTAIIGRLGDMYGKERTLLWTLVVLAAGTLLAAVSTSLAAADHRPLHPGRERRDLPALVRDRPRRVPAARRSRAASGSCRRSSASAPASASSSRASSSSTSTTTGCSGFRWWPRSSRPSRRGASSRNRRSGRPGASTGWRRR